MIDPADLIYLEMEVRRAELAAIVDALCEHAEPADANAARAAFLRYERTVVMVMHRNLEAMKTLVARAKRAEALNRPQETPHD